MVNLRKRKRLLRVNLRRYFSLWSRFYTVQKNLKGDFLCFLFVDKNSPKLLTNCDRYKTGERLRGPVRSGKGVGVGSGGRQSHRIGHRRPNPMSNNRIKAAENNDKSDFVPPVFSPQSFFQPLCIGF